MGALFVVSMAAWFALEAGLFIRENRPGRLLQGVDDRGSGLVLGMCIGTAIAIDVGLSRGGTQLRLREGVLFAAGIALVWAGLALRVWAVLTLGRLFRLVVVVQPGHRVIRHGPYRRLRHPSYSGTLLTMIGLGMSLDSWPGLIACVALPLIGYARRITVEEAALCERLGADYVEYTRTTRRLVPFVW